MKADYIVSNANVATMNPAYPRAEAFAVWNGQVLGFDSDIFGVEASESYDLGGEVVLPGFVDSHTHLGVTGLQMNVLDVTELESRSAVLRAIGDYAKGVSEGIWIDVFGYDQRKVGGSHLTISELDMVAGENPVWLRHFSSHLSVVNSRALCLMPDARARELTEAADGVLRETEQSWITDLRTPYSIAEIREAVQSAGTQCLAEGITRCIDAGIGAGLCSLSPIELLAFDELRQADSLPLKVQTMVSIDAFHGLEAASDDGMHIGLDLGLQPGFGDDWLSIGPAKLWLDGGMTTRTAAPSEPYTTGESGGLSGDPSLLKRKALLATQSGWDLALHAIGDLAVDLALDIFDDIRDSLGNKTLLRLEHGGMIREDQLPRLSRLSAHVVSQPCFLSHQGDDFAQLVGEDRVSMLYRGRSLLDHGVSLVGSTDRPFPGNPLRGIQFFMERMTNSGRICAPAEALTRYESVATFTSAAGSACGRGRQIGRLVPGGPADFVVLDDDPFACPTDQIAQIGVRSTVIDGIERWRADCK